MSVARILPRQVRRPVGHNPTLAFVVESPGSSVQDSPKDSVWEVLKGDGELVGVIGRSH